MKLGILRSEADGAARWREHVLHWEVPTRYNCGRETQTGTCDTCGAWVQVDTRPEPNGIDIGGPAVAVNCDC
jgi:hypothetical protein